MLEPCGGVFGPTCLQWQMVVETTKPLVAEGLELKCGVIMFWFNPWGCVHIISSPLFSIFVPLVLFIIFPFVFIIIIIPFLFSHRRLLHYHLPLFPLRYLWCHWWSTYLHPRPKFLHHHLLLYLWMSLELVFYWWTALELLLLAQCSVLSSAKHFNSARPLWYSAFYKCALYSTPPSWSCGHFSGGSTGKEQRYYIQVLISAYGCVPVWWSSLSS